MLVMDTTDLQDLPLTNDDPNLPSGVDVEAFWKADGRMASRVLLRHGDNGECRSFSFSRDIYTFARADFARKPPPHTHARTHEKAMAIAVAQAAAQAAESAAEASRLAQEAIESGNAERAAELALKCQDAALKSNEFIRREIQKTQDLKQRLIDVGVRVEILKGSKPIDVMNHLGRRSGYDSVVWRAGCWGNRGVEAILDGAFQRISSHLAVDATGGKFWQLILAERAVQSACGPERKLKVFAEDDSINLEYCDREDIDGDCALLFDGRPVRHVRLDARVAVIDEIRSKEKLVTRTVPMKKSFHLEEAPWF